MSFQQLYYTSCARGISGFPGFQFNAASDDVPPEVMRRVEGLTAYTPPKSVPYNADAAAIAVCPVNLCFEPADDHSVLANVVFLGNDYSKRFGNYFAHALVSTDIAGQLGEALPIELWRSPAWTHRESSDTHLDDLPAPPLLGPLDRAAAAEFLEVDPDRVDVLSALLTAVAAGMTASERRSTILIEETSELAAHWVALVSYLLPPALARRMSFATYHSRPAFCTLDLVATVPETEVERDSAAFTTYVQFDVPGGRSSDVAAADWAELLAWFGPRAAGELWAAARDLAGELPSVPDRWAALLSAALFSAPSLRAALSEAEAETVAAAAADWLATEGAARGGRAVARLGPTVLTAVPAGADGLPVLANLVAAANAVGAADLLLAAEKETTDRWIAVLRDGPAGEHATAAPLPRTAAGRTYAGEELARAFRGLAARRVLEMLTWAATEALPLPPTLLGTLGRKLVAPLAVDGRAAPETVTRLVGAWPELRDGVLDEVAAGAADTALATLSGLLTGPLARVAEEAGLDAWPALDAVWRLVRPDGDADPVDRLVRYALLGGHGGHGAGGPGGPDGPDDGWVGAHRARRPLLDADVLRLLWPDSRWTADEARRVVTELSKRPGALAGPPLAWLDAVLTRRERDADGDYLEDLDALCHAVRDAGLRLSEPADEVVMRHLSTERKAAAARKRGPVQEAKVLSAQIGGLDPVDAQGPQHKLNRLLEDLHREPDRLVAALSVLVSRALDSYLYSVDRHLRPDSVARLDIAVDLYYAQYVLSGNPAQAARDTADRIFEFLEPRLVEWPLGRLKGVEAGLGRLDAGAAKNFADWRDLSAGGWTRRKFAERRLRKEEEREEEAQKAAQAAKAGKSRKGGPDKSGKGPKGGGR
ncbi:GTPase-associated protein 1-related protein [Pseudofrankia asymbiotica]|uniref:Uncharacterized protein n=1 Tax=Pseudofrankia asymbiotica TaxID=1834516 RepID=A0A1V2I2Y2_9ACTN|nr:GTPase-associated protein 1-related protein [Pseudofrankia asymbiotica]ONH24749.1 hypothetical protein BL253_29430 [Pseudofrankia asymbiotica]